VPSPEKSEGGHPRYGDSAAQQVTAELTSATGTPTEKRARDSLRTYDMVIGNAVTQLNNQGFVFRVHRRNLCVDGGLQGAAGY